MLLLCYIYVTFNNMFRVGDVFSMHAASVAYHAWQASFVPCQRCGFMHATSVAYHGRQASTFHAFLTFSGTGACCCSQYRSVHNSDALLHV